MSQMSTYPKDAKSCFVCVLPELADAVDSYVTTTPLSCTFITKDGSKFIWYMTPPIKLNPCEQLWTLEKVYCGSYLP